MKLLIIDPVGNLGGGSRFLRCLIPALLEARPSLQIALLGSRQLFDREKYAELTHDSRLVLRELKSLRLGQQGLPFLPQTAPGVRFLQGRFVKALSWFPGRLSGDASREILRKSKGADVAFFPWPYLFPRPPLDCPAAAIFHDFNFKYFFGGFTPLFPWQLQSVERQMPDWLAGTHPVVSSRFMAGELARFYPNAPRAPDIIRVPPMIPPTTAFPLSSGKLLARLGIREPFALYPCNLHAHKNIGPMIGAVSMLRDRGFQLQLVLTGPYTERVRGVAGHGRVALGLEPADVIGTGYLPSAELECLIESAGVLVSSSLYEAGCGPALEGWAKGRPVAMSNIPSFAEQMSEFGVQAELFDPLSPLDISRALESILRDPGAARRRAEHSRKNIGLFTWKHAAQSYLSLFDRMRTEGAS